MKIWQDISLSEFTPWAGAVDTYKYLEEQGVLDALEFALDDLYPDGMSETTLNDLLWFDAEWVYEMLGISGPDDE